MLNSNKFSVPVELYAFLPMIATVSAVAIVRCVPESALLGALGVIILIAFFESLTRNTGATFYLLVIIWLHTELFPSTVVPYFGALGLASLLFLPDSSRRVPKVGGTDKILITTAALGALFLFPEGSPLKWIPILFVFVSSGLTLLGVILGLVSLRSVVALSDLGLPPDSSTSKATINPNRVRYKLHVILFLVLGYPIWQSLETAMGFAPALILQSMLSLLFPATLLAVFKISYESSPKIAEFKTAMEQFVAGSKEQIQKERETVEGKIKLLEGEASRRRGELTRSLRTEQYELESLTFQTRQQKQELAVLENFVVTQKAKLDRECQKRLSEVEVEIRNRKERGNREIQSLIDTRTAEAEKEIQRLRRDVETSFYRLSWDWISLHMRTGEVAFPGGTTVQNAKDYVFLGTREEGGSVEPALIHREILFEHIHIMGGTGAKKTSLGVIPILTSLIRYPSESERAGHPVVIFDFKGDEPLLHTARLEAEQNGKKFVFFTLEANKPTFRFNPIYALKKGADSRSEVVEPILDALGLNHQEGYGKSFFTKTHRQLFLDVLRKHENTIHSFDDLFKAIRSGGKRMREKEELVMALDSLREFPQLFSTHEEEENHAEDLIQFDRIFEERQVAYFWLPAPPQSITVREVGKMALYDAFFAAIRRQRQSLPKRKVFIAIDEVQRIVGENLSLFMEQARSYGISLILSNQNMAQLRTKDINLWPIINANVRASLHLGSGDIEELELLSKVSGESRDHLESFSEGWEEGTTTSVTQNTSSSDGASFSWGSATLQGGANSEGKTKGASFGSSRGSSQTVSGSSSQGSGASEQGGENVSSARSMHSARSRAQGSSASNSESATSGSSNSWATTSSESYALNHSRSEGFALGATFSRAQTRNRSRTEYIRPRYRYQDIQKVFNQPQGLILWIRRGIGMSDFEGLPVAIQAMFSMSIEEYQRRRNLPWPCPLALQTANEYRKRQDLGDKKMLSLLNDHLSTE